MAAALPGRYTHAVPPQRHRRHCRQQSEPERGSMHCSRRLDVLLDSEPLFCCMTGRPTLQCSPLCPSYHPCRLATEL